MVGRLRRLRGPGDRRGDRRHPAYPVRSVGPGSGAVNDPGGPRPVGRSRARGSAGWRWRRSRPRSWSARPPICRSTSPRSRSCGSSRSRSTSGRTSSPSPAPRPIGLRLADRLLPALALGAVADPVRRRGRCPSGSSSRPSSVPSPRSGWPATGGSSWRGPVRTADRLRPGHRGRRRARGDPRRAGRPAHPAGADRGRDRPRAGARRAVLADRPGRPNARPRRRPHRRRRDRRPSPPAPDRSSAGSRSSAGTRSARSSS